MVSNIMMMKEIKRREIKMKKIIIIIMVKMRLERERNLRMSRI
jgi:hypothetical protein